MAEISQEQVSQVVARVMEEVRKEAETGHNIVDFGVENLQARLGEWGAVSPQQWSVSYTTSAQDVERNWSVSYTTAAR